MEKLNNMYANDYDGANKNGVVFNQMKERRTAILNEVDALIIKEIPFFESQEQEYKTFFINHFDEKCCDVCLVCHNKQGNPVTRKYTIKLDMKAEEMINWGKLSRFLAGSRQTVRRNSIPKIHQQFVDDLLKAMNKVIKK
jgi:hypothetical protein